MTTVLELIRIRHWAKNAFVLAPLFFGGVLMNSGALLHGLEAFSVFCMVSSAIYIFNDWRDLDADRHHVTKMHRPLAAGKVGVPSALILMCLMLCVATLVTLFSGLPRIFGAIVLLYLAINVSYSLGLKQLSVLELFLIASGFVLRLLAGGEALSVELSPWIIIATGTIALLLTVGKRRGDIARENDGHAKRKSLRGYNLQYLDIVLAAVSGATLVVYVLFCVSDYAQHRYGHSTMLTAIPVAMGLLRYLQLVIVFREGDSPTDLLLRDRALILVVLVFLAAFGTLIYFR